jgi:hypothetical protein
MQAAARNPVTPDNVGMGSNAGGRLEGVPHPLHMLDLAAQHKILDRLPLSGHRKQADER